MRPGTKPAVPRACGPRSSSLPPTTSPAPNAPKGTKGMTRRCETLQPFGQLLVSAVRDQLVAPPPGVQPRVPSCTEVSAFTNPIESDLADRLPMPKAAGGLQGAIKAGKEAVEMCVSYRKRRAHQVRVPAFSWRYGPVWVSAAASQTG